MEHEEILSINFSSGGTSGSTVPLVDDLCKMFQTDPEQNNIDRDSLLYLECHGDESNDVLLEEQIDALHKETNHLAGNVTHIDIASGTSAIYRVSFPETILNGCQGNLRHFTCDLCLKSFTRKNLLQDHKSSVHKLLDLFPCSLCSYKGQRYRHWFKHMKRMHPEAKIILEQEKKWGSQFSGVNDRTDESFLTEQPSKMENQASYKEDVEEVVTSNTASPNHLCQVCGKMFTNRHSLRYHKRIHVEKSHTCLIPGCSKLFKNSSALNEHRITVHGVHIYKCPEKNCSKSYALKRDLNHHLSTHTGKFSCTVDGCTKTFRDQHSLNLHIKTHTGEKDQKCPYCSYVCIQRSALKLHKQRKHRHQLDFM